ncbi:MAG: aminoacyl-tRNA hydrolase [Flavobacterium sp.]|nr:MAG: aminoacyl-tRNA hydrolase [Flavobacterium sp.]
MDTEKITSETTFKAVRSGGAGGQHVNKVASKVILTFDVAASAAFSDEEKAILFENLGPRLNSKRELVVRCDDDRSQFRNRELGMRKLIDLLTDALHVAKERKPTKIPKAAVRQRLKEKKQNAEVKQLRKKPNY